VRLFSAQKGLCSVLFGWLLSYKYSEGIKMDLGENEWEGMDWIHLAQDRDQWLAVVNTVMNLQDP
jgi:hypothetical protein